MAHTSLLFKEMKNSVGGNSVKMLWKAWYGDEALTLVFPERWNVQVNPMCEAPDIGDRAIEESFDNPIASACVEEIASGKKTVAIAVDDLSRPTQAHRLLPSLVVRLRQAGTRQENIIYSTIQLPAAL